MTGAAASERNKWQGTNNSKKKSKANSIASKSIDYSSSLSSDQEIDPVRKKVRHQSRLLLADGAFDVSQLTRDLWLDNRQSVQNGTRCIRCDVNNVRYMCTSRSLRELEEGQSREIVKRFKQVFQAQKDLALLTTFVQPVIAARAHRWDLLVINPLPSNMYLCDLKKLAVHLSHSTVRYYAACILLGLEFMRHQCIYHGNLPGQMQLRIDSNDEGPTTMKSGTFDRLIRYGAVIAGSVNTGGQAAEQKEGKARSGHNQGSVIPQTNCSNSSAAENNLTQEQKAIPVTSAALVGINKLINNDFQSDEQYEFVFNGYQQMMQHKYFTGTNWAALETAQPPEGFWFVHSLIMQHYSREQAAPNQGAAGNAGVGDDTDRLIGSYFTSRSRILYSLFG